MSSHRRAGRQVLLTALALVALVVTGVGFAATATTAQSVKLDACENGRYYPGYDPQSIRPENRTRYISAVDLESSVFCIDLPRDQEVTSLRFLWLSKAEMPHRIRISLESEDGKKRSEEVGVSVDEIDGPIGFPISNLQLDPPAKTKRIVVRVLEGGEQSRLLLRNVEVTTR